LAQVGKEAMMIRRIAGATRVLGKAQGYLGLPVRDVLVNDSVNGPSTPAMETAWEPMPDELERLAEGASVVVQLLGSLHPPIMLGVAHDLLGQSIGGNALNRIAALVPPGNVEIDGPTAVRALREIRHVLEET
jgi:hypothetical protein